MGYLYSIRRINTFKHNENIKNKLTNYMKYKKINSWNNQTLYHAINDNKMTIPFTVTNITDKIGPLKRVECSITGDFEVYGMKEVKKRIEAESVKVYFN